MWRKRNSLRQCGKIARNNSLLQGYRVGRQSRYCALARCVVIENSEHKGKPATLSSLKGENKLMSSVDVFSGKFSSYKATGKNEMLGFGIVESKPDYKMTDVDLLARHFIDGYDPPSQGKSHTELGIDLAKYGTKAIAAAGAANLAGSGFIAASMGIAGGILLPFGIVFITIGLLEMARELSTTTEPTGPSPFHLIDPNDLSLDGTKPDTESNDSFHLLDPKQVNDSFHLLDPKQVNDFYKDKNASLNKTFDSVREKIKGLKAEKESNMGRLSERGIGETGNTHLSENRSEY
jgi:hypothetical protein